MRYRPMTFFVSVPFFFFWGGGGGGYKEEWQAIGLGGFT